MAHMPEVERFERRERTEGLKLQACLAVINNELVEMGNNTSEGRTLRRSFSSTVATLS